MMSGGIWRECSHGDIPGFFFFFFSPSAWSDVTNGKKAVVHFLFLSFVMQKCYSIYIWRYHKERNTVVNKAALH